MRAYFLILGLVGFAAVCPAPAQQTVNEAVSIAYSQMPPDTRPPLLGLRIKDSIDGEIWELLFVDQTHAEGHRVMVLKDGKLDSSRYGTIWPFNEGRYAPVLPSQITQKITDLRRLVHSSAVEGGLKPAAITYILCRKYGERDAVWNAYYLNDKKVILGYLCISSLDGSVIAKSYSPPPSGQ